MVGAIAIGRGESSEEIGLVLRARGGDAVAFDHLIRPRIDRLLRIALSIMSNESDARDAVQDSCLRVWRELPRLRDPERFEAWLTRIVVNDCRTKLRGRRRSTVREIPAHLLVGGSELSGPRLGFAEALSDTDVVQRAFARLDADKRAILVLHHVEEQSIAEIAASMGIPEGTVKWRLHAARTSLERALRMERR